MNTNPLISVSMPVYNAEEYLDQSIQSILNQTYKDFEFLIFNFSKGFYSIIEDYLRSDMERRLIIVCGGGAPARMPQHRRGGGRHPRHRDHLGKDRIPQCPFRLCNAEGLLRFPAGGQLNRAGCRGEAPGRKRFRSPRR